MAERGCCCFFATSLASLFRGSGGGGGGGPDATLIWVCSSAVITTIVVSSLSGWLLTDDDDDLLSLMLRKYSEGLMRLLVELALLGKLGGMKGRTLCLLTRLGPRSSLSAPILTIVKSEQEELRRRLAGRVLRVGFNYCCFFLN